MSSGEFGRISEEKLKNTPAFAFNNLARLPGKLAYMSKAHVCCVAEDDIGGGSALGVETLHYKDSFPLFGVSVITLPQGPTTAVGSRSGMHFYANPGTKIGVLPISTCGTSGRGVFMRCATALPGTETVAVGASNGVVVMCRVTEDSVSEMSTQPAGAEPINALAATGRFLAAGDDAGNVFLWRTSDGSLAHTFHGDGFPCTSVAMAGDLIVAGFASGHLRVFRAEEPSLAVEAEVHSRAITALDLNPHRMVVATVGEDSHINILQLPTFEGKGSGSVDLLASHVVLDQLLTGVAFTSKGDTVAACAYDSPELHVVSASV